MKLENETYAPPALRAAPDRRQSRCADGIMRSVGGAAEGAGGGGCEGCGIRIITEK